MYMSLVPKVGCKYPYYCTLRFVDNHCAASPSNVAELNGSHGGDGSISGAAGRCSAQLRRW